MSLWKNGKRLLKSERNSKIKRIEGSIESIHKNYGIIKSKDGDYDVEYLFYIFPDMISDGVFKSTSKVTFLRTTFQIRGVKVFLAYDVQPIVGQKEHNFEVQKLRIDDKRDYHDFIFKTFYKENDNCIIDALSSEDIRFKEFILKWVLFLENEIKKSSIRLIQKYDIPIKKVYEVLSKNKETKKIHNDLFKKLKTNYVFRNEFELLEISRTDSGDVRGFEVQSAPFELYLENNTIDELGKIINVFFKAFNRDEWKHDEDSMFLENSLEMFLELSIIRNACAHGNPFIPLILDDKYSPNYLRDLSSVYPDFNSGDSVKDWKLFKPLSWVTRQLTKIGIAPNYKGGLQHTGLYTAKYILINPARRSFFSFLFIIEYFFRFIAENTDSEIEFKREFNVFLPYFKLNEDDSDDKNKLFVNYPKSDPVLAKINRFIYPIYYGEDAFWALVRCLK
ncbi:hypothetical protein [Streptococcus thermophilus]|uniref:hypothetical protein n=1 Tax=Streptococcus thermophilus TaxID=1308 RepID=UPI0032194B1A